LFYVLSVDKTLEFLNCVIGAIRMPPAIRLLSSRKMRLAFFHKGLPSLAEILRVHAGRGDFLYCVHIAHAGISQHLCDGDFGGLDCQRCIA
jgi:hypothetical protein